MRALITGISGQDGAWLSRHLLGLGYEVSGIIRRNSTPEFQTGRLEEVLGYVDLHYGDMTDVESLNRIVRKTEPDEVYNLASMSHVRISFDVPEYTMQVNGAGALRMLQAVREYAPEAKFYQASSSEMFGLCVDDDGHQRETTPMRPVSPYGCAKVFAYNMACHFRSAYGMFVSNGILFNHESEYRGSNFVTQKVIKTAVEIKRGLSKELVLGNMDSYRDWGDSRDFVRAMHLILQQENPDDFVIATGKTRSVRDLCDFVFKRLGMNYRDHVVQHEKFLRPEELTYLNGDSSKARKTLGWKPEITYEQMIDDMVEAWERHYAQRVS